MKTGDYEYQSDFARRYVAEGKAEGLAEAILDVLAARGFEIPSDVRADRSVYRCGTARNLDQAGRHLRLGPRPVRLTDPRRGGAAPSLQAATHSDLGVIIRT